MPIVMSARAFLILPIAAALSSVSVAAEKHKARHAPSSIAPSCTIEAAGVNAVDEGKMKGAWVHIGEIYHFGSLAIRVNGFDYSKGFLVDIKAPDYDGAGWHMPADGGPANFKACGKDVSVAIISVAGYGNAFTVGTF